MKKVFYFLSIILSATALSACSGSDDDDDNTPAVADKSMYVGDSTLVGKKAKVDDRFVAYISDNGYMHAYHVGEANYSMNGKSAKVVVRGLHNALNVVTDWGITPDQLKSKVAYTPFTENTSDDGFHTIIYKNIGCANLLGYGFKNNKLTSALAYSSPTDEDEILKYLAERYIFSPEEVSSYTWAGFNGLEESKITTFAFIKFDTDYKYIYMLQTMFMSKELSLNKSDTKALKMQAKQMILQTPALNK